MTEELKVDRVINEIDSTLYESKKNIKLERVMLNVNNLISKGVEEVERIKFKEDPVWKEYFENLDKELGFDDDYETRVTLYNIEDELRKRNNLLANIVILGVIGIVILILFKAC